MITTQAMKAGFYGGLVVDYPNSTKAKKYYLVLMTGGVAQLPKGLGMARYLFKVNQIVKIALSTNLLLLFFAGTGADDSNQVSYTRKREMLKQARGKLAKGSKEWIIKKKERRRRQGKETREDSKYTGRKRSGRF